MSQSGPPGYPSGPPQWPVSGYPPAPGMYIPSWHYYAQHYYPPSVGLPPGGVPNMPRIPVHSDQAMAMPVPLGQPYVPVLRTPKPGDLPPQQGQLFDRSAPPYTPSNANFQPIAPGQIPVTPTSTASQAESPLPQIETHQVPESALPKRSVVQPSQRRPSGQSFGDAQPSMHHLPSLHQSPAPHQNQSVPPLTYAVPQPVPSLAATSQSVPVQSIPTQTVSSQAPPHQAVSSQAAPPQTVPSQAVTPETLSPQIMRSQSLPSGRVPTQTMSPQTAPPTQPTSAQGVPSQVTPSQIMHPQPVPSNKTVSTHIAQAQPVENQTVPIQAISGQTGPSPVAPNHATSSPVMFAQTNSSQGVSSQAVVPTQGPPPQTVPSSGISLQTAHSQDMPSQAVSSQAVQSHGTSSQGIQSPSVQTPSGQAPSGPTLAVQAAPTSIVPIQTPTQPSPAPIEPNTSASSSRNSSQSYDPSIARSPESLSPKSSTPSFSQSSSSRVTPAPRVAPVVQPLPMAKRQRTESSISQEEMRSRSSSSQSFVSRLGSSHSLLSQGSQGSHFTYRDSINSDSRRFSESQIVTPRSSVCETPACKTYIFGLQRVYEAGSNRYTRLRNVEDYIAQYWDEQIRRYKDAINKIRVTDKFTQATSYCADCKKRFQKPTGFRRHRLTYHHPDLRPLQCLVCPHSSVDSAELLDHIITHPLIEIASLFVPRLSEDDAACLTLRISQNFKERKSQSICATASKSSSSLHKQLLRPSPKPSLPDIKSEDNNIVADAIVLTKPPVPNGSSETQKSPCLTRETITPHFAPHSPPTTDGTTQKQGGSSAKSLHQPKKECIEEADDTGDIDIEEASKVTGIDVATAYQTEGEGFGPTWEKQFQEFLTIVQSFQNLRESETGCHWCIKLTNEDKYWNHSFTTHSSARPLHCIFCKEKVIVPSALISHIESCEEHTKYLLDKYGSLLLSRKLKPAMSKFLRKRCDQSFYPPKLHKSTAWIQSFLSWNEEPSKQVINAYNSGNTLDQKLANVEECIRNYWIGQSDAMDQEVRNMREREQIGTKDTFCVDCDKSFDTPAHFRIHRFGVHYPEKRPLRCLICLSQFAHVQSLWAHLKAHRPDKTATYFADKIGEKAALQVAELCCKRVNIPKRSRSNSSTQGQHA